ncbi:adenylate/guanylate cyclase domain-containing protein [Magnetospira sp. QH-2]|uniref:adenylate/guanylate cyclase domain-containing protein n=1 Tax=Magnetospira sp. (strain QH-2) TaxID=1288970 RepID=UPI0003E818C8|nr:adenylate/guanylate cyclase domain-containing protein [Magnetospira sp. QH-2]CCQ73652.1 Conserved protein of unknown function. Containing adenylate cyclase domain [Magnetospira sp. QH-2]
MKPSDDPIDDWLYRYGWSASSVPELLTGLSQQLRAFDIPVGRARVTLRTLHPQAIGTSYTWVFGQEEVAEVRAPHEIIETDRYLKSPYAKIFEDGSTIRRRLIGPDIQLDYNILPDLVDEGYTDYLALPIVFGDGSLHALTLASDGPEGFDDEQIERLTAMTIPLSRALEVHALRYTARTVLETYLGGKTGAKVLDGQVRRGDGDDIHSVIWFCDLRGSTPMADILPRPEYLNLLNEFFECMAGAVLGHGGEVLRYVGDAVLAIFPIDAPPVPNPEKCPIHRQACIDALAAATDAMGRMDDLNRERTAAGEEPLGYGIALHMGDVTYGNIGTPERLEFTVIGPAANEAARLEGFCKTLDQPLLLSDQFAKITADRCISLGEQALRGVDRRMTVYTLAQAAVR